MATRTGVSTLRQLLRQMCKLAGNHAGLLANPEIPVEIAAALAVLIAACLASTFEDPGAGEIQP
jgi:hypothetical protein